jgi:hypothetical protein
MTTRRLRQQWTLTVLAGALIVLAAVTLAAGAAAAPDAAKQRVAFGLSFYPGQTFRFVPLTKGTLKSDSGRLTRIPQTPGRNVIRDGQKITIFNVTWTLEGKLGTVALRERSEWVGLDVDTNKDGHEDAIALGTWKLVRGTGQYAGLAGGGRSGHAGLGNIWNARYEGFLTAR